MVIIKMDTIFKIWHYYIYKDTGTYISLLGNDSSGINHKTGVHSNYLESIGRFDYLQNHCDRDNNDKFELNICGIHKIIGTILN